MGQKKDERLVDELRGLRNKHYNRLAEQREKEEKEKEERVLKIIERIPAACKLVAEKGGTALRLVVDQSAQNAFIINSPKDLEEAWPMIKKWATEQGLFAKKCDPVPHTHNFAHIILSWSDTNSDF